MVGRTVMVTTMFTDLVDSTALASRLGADAADDLRRNYFGLLRGSLAVGEGIEVKSTGDGLHVTFPTVSGAVQCATAMQQAIDRFNHDAPEPLAVRIGISHGEVELADDDDYYGMSVVEAARLCAAATGEQILTTELVRALVGSRGRHEFEALGSFELKGLPERVPLVAVRWEPLPPDEPEGHYIPLPHRWSEPPATGFVGRNAELDLLWTALKQAQSGSHRVVLVGGEPGIGKTTLCSQFARVVHDQDAIVLYGRCDADVGTPYQAWAGALDHLVAHASPALLERLAPYAAPLAHLVPGFAARGVEVFGEISGDAETARYVLFGAVHDALRVAGDHAPVVVVLDDLQWADLPSLQLLRHVASARDPLRVVVCGTFRDSEVDAAHPLAGLLAALHSEAGVERVRLTGLDDVEVLELMEGAAGHAIDQAGIELRDALLRETDGNPFFVGELLRHLAETGAIYQQDGRWVTSVDLRGHGLPVSVREVTGQRVARLGDLATRALRLASVIGREFEFDLLAEAGDFEPDSLLDVLDNAIDATLVVNIAPDRYSFVHALVEHALYDATSPARRARLHRRVAEAIETQVGTDPGDRVAELAYQWSRATGPDRVDKAIRYARAAGDRALSELAPDEALRWYCDALSLLDTNDTADEALRCRLLVRLGDAQRQTGSSAYRETLLDAARRSAELGLNDVLIAAALTNTRGYFSAAGQVDDERIAVLEKACRIAASQPGVRARLLALLASELVPSPDVERRLAVAREALDVARAVGDPVTLVGVLNARFQAVNLPRSLPELHSDTGEALELASELGDPLLEYWAATDRNVTALDLGDLEEADRCLGVMTTIARRLRQPVLLWQNTFVRCARAMLAGDLQEAERLNEEAVALGTASGQPDALLIYGGTMICIRIIEDRAAEVLDLLILLCADNPELPEIRALLAQAYCTLDRFEEASGVVEPEIAAGFQSRTHDFIWLMSVTYYAETIADLSLTGAAAKLLDVLTPFENHVAYFGVGPTELPAHSLARLAATLGDRDRAEAYFATAHRTIERFRAPYLRAKNDTEWGRLLLSSDSANTRARGRAMVERAQATASSEGYRALERRASRVLAHSDQR